MLFDIFVDINLPAFIIKYTTFTYQSSQTTQQGLVNLIVDKWKGADRLSTMDWIVSRNIKLFIVIYFLQK